MRPQPANPPSGSTRGRDKNGLPPCQFKGFCQKPPPIFVAKPWPRPLPRNPAGPAAKAAHPVSPLAPAKFPGLPPLAGVRIATGEAGVRYKNRTDVLLVTLAPGTQVAGGFTKSKTASATVD